ncbi:MAG: sulfurtransferase TusA family protein [Ornithinibacter sp.]
MSGSEPPPGDEGSGGRGRRGGPPVVDARGSRCPVPVIRLARAALGLPPGTTVVLLADDDAAWSDVPAWARMKGHTVSLHEDEDWTEYRVLLGPPRTERGQADSST